jgi:mannose-6-phosphate isomerase
MKTVAALSNPIRDYAWGSTDAIARLQRRPTPTATPEAELWMGAHPRASSQVLIDGDWRSLWDLLQRDPEGILGTRVNRAFSGRLPFLFKVLAAGKPLSIQAHPDAQQAREGFARENARGVPLSAPQRNYSDDNHKPELLCALTPFAALRGFRSIDAIQLRFDGLTPRTLSSEVQALRAQLDSRGLRHFFASLLELDGRRRQDVVAEAVAGAEAAGDADPELAWVRRLHAEFPNDIGVLAPLFLNLVELAPGEAMFLPAGELHAYLSGTGIELMANSDNVLRGGLTQKHVDVDELMRILRFTGGPPPVLRPLERAPFERVYPTPAAEFELALIQLHEREVFESDGERGVEIALCTEGEVRIVDLATQTACELASGDSALVPAVVEAYRIEGRGTVYRASVPRANPRDR